MPSVAKFVSLVALFASSPGLAAGQAAPPTAATNPLGLSIQHATMGVASIDLERAFFRDILGFAVGPLKARPKYNLQQMFIPGFRIDMIEQQGSVRPAAEMGTDKQGWLHLAFQVPDAEATYRLLKSKGAAAVPGRMDGTKIGSVFVTDPEGNRIELAER